MSSLRNLVCTGVPSIAQLVERRTVEVKLTSLGRWFKSGSKEFLFSFNSAFLVPKEYDSSPVAIVVAIYSFLFSWSKWQAACIAGAGAQRRTTTTTTSHNMAAILPSPANTKYWFTAYVFDI